MIDIKVVSFTIDYNLALDLLFVHLYFQSKMLLHLRSFVAINSLQ